MSVVTDVYDTIHARLPTLFPSHLRLSNPYAPEENPESVIKQAYGLKVGAATNTNRNVGCKISISREYSVVFTRKYYANELDASAKASTEKLLLEDARLVENDVEQNVFLIGVANNPNIKFISDTGIEFVFAENKPFYKIEVLLLVEYFETLT